MMRAFGVRGVLTVVAIVASSVGAAPLRAQHAAAGWIQVGLGGGTSRGGAYMNREELTLEALVVRGSDRGPGLRLLRGGALSGVLGAADGDCVALPGTPCRPNPPRFATATAFVGGAVGGRYGSVGVLAGPSVYFGASRVRLGGTVRVDFASPPIGPLAMVLTPRLQVVPGVAGATFTVPAVVVGVRVR